MKIQAEVSLYPLRTKKIAQIVNSFCAKLTQENLVVKPGAMSTQITGDIGDVFESLENAFIVSAEKHDVILTVKFSNTCLAEVENT